MPREGIVKNLIRLMLALILLILPVWAAIWPSEWAVPFIDWINAVVAVLKDYAVFGLFTFKDITRAIASAVEQTAKLWFEKLPLPMPSLH